MKKEETKKCLEMCLLAKHIFTVKYDMSSECYKSDWWNNSHMTLTTVRSFLESYFGVGNVGVNYSTIQGLP